VADYDLNDCPKPYPPWMEGAQKPEVLMTVQLQPGESIAGAIVTMVLERPADVLEKALTLVENLDDKHATWRVDWAATDLVAGVGQLATFILTRSGGEEEHLARWLIDVTKDPRP
jgi:hypothetical protein